jgi:hypothetical protein
MLILAASVGFLPIADQALREHAQEEQDRNDRREGDADDQRSAQQSATAG